VSATNNLAATARLSLIQIISDLAHRQADLLQRLKRETTGLDREDFVWHYLLQAFATWGSSRGWDGLIHTPSNYKRVTYDVLLPLTAGARIAEADAVFRLAGVRYPAKKAAYLSENLDRIEAIGGLVVARAALLEAPGAAGKVRFLSQFKGISKKYARNILMDVYHPEFRDSIAIDERIKRVTEAIGLTFDNYEDHEQYLVEVAHEAGLNGWELDRLLYNFRDDVLAALRVGNAAAGPPGFAEVPDPPFFERLADDRYDKTRAHLIAAFGFLRQKGASETDIADAHEAATLMIELHLDQKDRPDGAPYVEHTTEVGRNVAEWMADADAVLVMAALLHDSLEDQYNKLGDGTPAGAYDELARRYGSEVADLVAAVTNPDFDAKLAGIDRNTPEFVDAKNRLYLEHVQEIAETDQRALTIKIADFSTNALRLDRVTDPMQRAKLEAKYGPVLTFLREHLEAIAAHPLRHSADGLAARFRTVEAAPPAGGSWSG
jgi:hypothetical protein